MKFVKCIAETWTEETLYSILKDQAVGTSLATMFNERRAANRQSARAGPSNNSNKEEKGLERDTRRTREKDRAFKPERRYGENYRKRSSEFDSPSKRPPPEGDRYRSEGRNGYYDSNYGQQGYGNGRRYGGRPNERGTPRGRNDAGPIVPLDSLGMTNSQWDKYPAKLKGMSARFAKSAGVFSSRSESSLEQLTEENIVNLIKQQNNLLKMRKSRLGTQRIMGPTESKLSKRVIVKGVDFDKVAPQSVQKFLESFLASVVIPDVSYEDLTLTSTVEGGTLVIDCTTSLVATTLVSFNSKHIPELEANLIVERPGDYIEIADSQNQEESLPDVEVLEQIVETSGLCCANNIPEDMSNGKFKEILQKYGNLRSAILLIGKVTYECCGVAFFSFYSTKKSINETIEDINKEEKWDCFLACKNQTNEYSQQCDIKVANVKDFIDTKSKDITKHKVTSTIQLLNSISIEDALDDTKYNQVKDAFEEELSQLSGYEKLVLVRPSQGFRIQQIDEVQPEFGRILVTFKTPKDAEACLNKVCGRYFHGRVIMGGFLDDLDYRDVFAE